MHNVTQIRSSCRIGVATYAGTYVRSKRTTLSNDAAITT